MHKNTYTGIYKTRGSVSSIYNDLDYNVNPALYWHTNTNTYPNKFLATNLIERCAKNKESYQTKNVEDKAAETTGFDRLFMTTYTSDLTITFTELSLQTKMSFPVYKIFHNTMTKTDEYFGFVAFAVLPPFWGIVTLQTKRQVNNQNSNLTHKN